VLGRVAVVAVVVVGGVVGDVTVDGDVGVVSGDGCLSFFLLTWLLLALGRDRESEEVAGDGPQDHRLEAAEVEEPVGDRLLGRRDERLGRVVEVDPVESTDRPHRAAAVVLAQQIAEPVDARALRTQELLLGAVRHRCDAGLAIDAVLGEGAARPNAGREITVIILPALGDRPLDDITTTEIQRLHHGMRDRPCAANNVRMVLCCMYSKAEQWGLTTRRNPVKNVSRFHENTVERYLSAEERERLEQVLRRASTVRLGRTGHIGQEAVWAIRLLALAGMRKDEIRNLTWAQVDWQRSMLRLPDSKTGKRDVVVSDEVMDLLRSIAEAKGRPRQGLVVHSRNNRKLHSLNATWLVIRRLADLGDMRMHDLRHSVASDAIMDGVPLEIVGKMLGHRNYTTTQRYAHIADTVLRDAVNRTSKKIVRTSEGTSQK